MAYSTIKAKPYCKCGCGKLKSMSCNGYNYNCISVELKEKLGTRRKIAQKNKNARNRVRSLIDKKPTEEKNLQELWFSMVAQEIRKHPYCSECNSWIPPEYYRAASAHLIFKSIFKSVAIHPDNYLILCAANGCHDKTHRMDTFSKMRCFSEAVRKFRIFEHLITEKHKLLDEFLKYANTPP